MDSGLGGISTGPLVAVPFDAQRLAVLGSPVPVADSVQVGGSSRTGKLGISRGGAIAFASGEGGRMELVTVGRDGTSRALGAKGAFYVGPRLSPDGKRIAVQVTDAGSDIWTFDIAGRTLTRLTFERTAVRPIWTPDGRRIIYARRGPKGQDLAWIPADGSAPAESLVVDDHVKNPGDVTRDGRSLVIRESSAGAKRMISIVRLDSAHTTRPFIVSAFENFSPSLSPDGRWVAYASDESGRGEVYVRPFPGAGGKWQISKDGGGDPHWSGTGREIFFRSGPSMMVATVQAGATFAPGEVHELFRTSVDPPSYYKNYDVSRDGKTFILLRPSFTNDQSLVVLLNWFEQLPVRP